MVDLAAMRVGHGAARRRPAADQPARAGRSGHRPLGAGRPFGTGDRASPHNVELEYERNRERYEFLRWAQQAFQNFRVVPPGTGIVHQVNLEYLARVVVDPQDGDETVAFPDTLVGTDSHTTMINGLGVVGWGVGGIEAEACMLGQPIYMLTPEVVGFKLTASSPEGATATDLVLTVTQILRKHGVVGKFVEFFGAGLSSLALADRATIANMAPEYGATRRLLPGRRADAALPAPDRPRTTTQIDLVERYCKEQGLFRTDESPEPEFNERARARSGAVVPSVAGPRRPQDRVPLETAADLPQGVQPNFASIRADERDSGSIAEGEAGRDRSATATATTTARRRRTSATSRSKSARKRSSSRRRRHRRDHQLHQHHQPVGHDRRRAAGKEGGRARADVPSLRQDEPRARLAGGDRLSRQAGLQPYLDALGFHTVGYGCTTCIGNSGPLPEPIADAVEKNDLVVAAVLSGNRNFEGRDPPARAGEVSGLAAAGRRLRPGRHGRHRPDDEPLGNDRNGEPVFLRDIWPTQEEVQKRSPTSRRRRDVRRRIRRRSSHGDERWHGLPVPSGELYDWDADITYIQEPPFFTTSRRSRVRSPTSTARACWRCSATRSRPTTSRPPVRSRRTARPANTDRARRPAARLQQLRLPPRQRRVMTRGTFANIRLRNQLAPGTEGAVTVTCRPARR